MQPLSEGNQGGGIHRLKQGLAHVGGNIKLAKKTLMN